MSTPPATFPATAFLDSGGEMARRMREFDWSQHPLGPPAQWPQSLKVAIRIMLNSRFAMWMGWGPEFFFFCNDAYAPTLGIKLDSSLGHPARKVWPEVWHAAGPRAESVMRTSQATWDESLLLFLERSGYTEETYHTFSYSPIPDDAGGAGGILCVVTEETARVIGKRRLAMLQDLGSHIAVATQSEDALFTAIRGRFAAFPQDLPFALIYLFDADGKTARLTCAHGTAEGGPLAPAAIPLSDGGQVWPAGRLFTDNKRVLVDELSTRFPEVPSGPWDRSPRRAKIVPLSRQGAERPAGFLVAGVNPYRALDADYVGFLDLLAAQIAGGLATVRAYEAERRRAEALAEIDRAKTAFFSNVSHEFRTPLTLLLSPLEEMVNRAEGEIREDNRTLATLAHRNAMRLLKLVNSLLDYARIEAGRARAQFEPTDLASLTAELASAFRSAMVQAGIDYQVDCPPLPSLIHVDRDMWEKIVLNLLSNAFKFTMEGVVRLSLRPVEGGVELAVQDTGAGIPEEAQPHLFERFYRVPGSQGRSQEGSGIGLALVHELVKLHGGTVRVTSAVDEGSTFSVTLRTGSAHLPPEWCTEPSARKSVHRAAAPFLAEARLWLPETATTPDVPAPQAVQTFPGDSARPRILVADDNTDMRDYITRLLSPHYTVTTVPEGEAALAAARQERPDLVLSDVMMPKLDGFALVRALRSDPATRDLSVILLSARAGEEARAEGMETGADDYLVKPFNARELLARIRTNLDLVRMRQAAAQAVRESDERYRAFVANSSEGIWRLEFDPPLDTSLPVEAQVDQAYRNGRLAECNDVMARMYGLSSAAELTGVSLDFMMPQSDPEARAYLASIIESGYRATEVHSVERDAAGHTVHFLNSMHGVVEDGQLKRIWGTQRNITQRKLVEDALRASEKQLRFVTDHMPVFIVHCDAEGRYVFVNRPYAERFGLKVDDIIGRRIPEIVGEHAYETFRMHVETVLRGEQVDWEQIIPYEQMGPQWVHAMYVPDILPSGEVVGFVGVIQDITLRKQIEESLRVARDEAEQASQAKDSFLAVLSHELRTPLTPVFMTVTALEHHPELPEDIRRELAMMKRNIELETKLIDDLLDLNRIRAGKLQLDIQPVDLNETVRRVCDICQSAAAERGIVIETQLDEVIIPLAADSARLQQVLWNLVNNAIKFTSSGGQVVIGTERLPDTHCTVFVRDTGIGIPVESLGRIFDAFEQGGTGITRQFGGLGLGLAICKALVALHGGEIRAESGGTNQGAKFIIKLPCTPAALQDIAIPEDTPSSRPELRLLVVDDHADTLATLERLLTRRGYTVRTAGSIADALNLSTEYDFDVLVSDIGLPDGRGTDLLAQLEATRGGPILSIAMSGFGMDEDLERSRAAGFSEHLTKPVEFPSLHRAITRVAALKK